jgi:hypothetical protein
MNDYDASVLRYSASSTIYYIASRRFFCRI